MLLISFIGIILLLNWSQEKDANKVLLKPVISIKVKGENVFLTESELYARLRLKKYVYNKQIAAKLPIHEIEKFISEMTEVKSVKVYKKHGAKWLIDVVLKSPIARVFDSNNWRLGCRRCLSRVLLSTDIYSSRGGIICSHIV